MRYGHLSRLLVLVGIILSVQLSPGLVAAEDAAGMVRQIQKSLNSIKRRIVTQPGKAEAELAETMAMFEELKAAEPNDENISRLDKSIDDLQAKLAKRLGRTVQPLGKTAAPKPVEPKDEVPAVVPKSAPAVAGSELPAAVKSRIRKIDKALDKVNKALDRNSVQRAEMEFERVDKTLQEIQKRYGDKAPPDHPEMMALSERIGRVESRMQQAAGDAAAGAAAQQRAEDENAELADAWLGKLSPFVSRGGERYLSDMPWKLQGAAVERNRGLYTEAQALFKEYQAVSFPLGKPMELKNAESALRSTLKGLSKTYAKEASEQGSADWVAKLKPFVTPMGGRQLIASYTADVRQMQHQQAIYNEASKLFEQYRKAEFPQGKSQELQRIEARLADELAKFPEVLKRGVGDQVANAEAKLDQEMAFLNSKQAWKNDPKQLPYYLATRRIADAQALLDRAAELVPADDPALAALNAKMAQLVRLNDERIKVRAERTRMIPDRFTGNGMAAIKKKAAALVTARIPGVEVLRTTVISEEWQEESVQEWTDTTKTAIRHRTSRSVTAQVAGKKPGGEVRLYSVHVAKDLRKDGGWGKLYGNLHSDLGDLMLAENVHK